jgi:hypothetical protein
LSTTDLAASHPLASLHLARLADWAAWLERWCIPTLSFEERLGLLHSGFNLPAAQASHRSEAADQAVTAAGRACFYLELADGHMEAPENFLTPAETSQRGWALRVGDLGVMRQALAAKAFAMVVQHLLRPALSTGRDSRERSASEHAWYVLLAPPVLEKLLWFFRANDVDYLTLVNVGSEYQSERDNKHSWTRKFIVALAAWAWGLRDYQHPHQLPRSTWAAEHRHRFIDLLLSCGKIEALLDARLKLFDDASWRRLEELALRPQWLPLYSEAAGAQARRTPVSLEEAAVFGGPEARVCLLLRLRQQQEALLEQSRHTTDS